MTKKTTVALIYDFDKTLCTKDMQEYTFIPNIGKTPKEFWTESNKFANDEKMDKILSYMYHMILGSSFAKKSIHRKDFEKMGEDIEFFPGVDSWFKRIEEYGKKKVTIEHYVISSGLKEIIEGSKIYKPANFKEIYACEFYYNENGIAVWPLSVVNYTTKTQFLFRINKGVLDVADDESVNKFTPENERKIPFRNMIYIGDGMTDVPCMKLVKSHGGNSIAVYNSSKKDAQTLLLDDRVNYIAKADYSEGTELDEIVKQIIDKISVEDELVKKQVKMQKEAKKQIEIQKEAKRKKEIQREAKTLIDEKGEI